MLLTTTMATGRWKLPRRTWRGWWRRRLRLHGDTIVDRTAENQHTHTYTEKKTYNPHKYTQSTVRYDIPHENNWYFLGITVIDELSRRIIHLARTLLGSFRTENIPGLIVDIVPGTYHCQNVAPHSSFSTQYSSISCYKTARTLFLNMTAKIFVILKHNLCWKKEKMPQLRAHFI